MYKASPDSASDSSARLNGSRAPFQSPAPNPTSSPAKKAPPAYFQPAPTDKPVASEMTKFPCEMRCSYSSAANDTAGDPPGSDCPASAASALLEANAAVQPTGCRIDATWLEGLAPP